MKKTKKLICIITVFIILLSCFSIFAFAETETVMGTYNGYGYTCYAKCTSSQVSVQFSSSCPTQMKISGTIGYKINSTNYSTPFLVRGYNSITYPNNINATSFVYVNANYYFATTSVASIFVSA